MIGEKVSHFQILEKLGEGGMGVVYKARDLNLDRIVALKFLPRQLTANENEKERFYHEGRAASALNHPNITTIYEIQESDGQVFLAMEFVDGVTLKQYLQTQSPSIPTILDLAIQVCSGLSAAHRRGVVHRDVKADNILVTPERDVKITDFGLAKLQGASRLTVAGSTLGTVAYMSPEQAQGQEVDERTDIFSCGVVLYELLTGRLPFGGEHQAAVIYAIINEDPLPIARYTNKVSPELERIVAKALAKDKTERYQHADEMLADLKRERKNLERLNYEQTHKTGSFVTAPPDATRVESRSPASAPAAIPVDRLAEDAEIRHSRAKKRLLRLLVPSAVILILVLLLLIFNPFNLQTTFLKGNAAEQERSLAVLYFQNIPDPEDKDHTGDMLTDLLTTALSQDKTLQVVSRERLYDIEKELGQGDTKVIAPSMAQKLADRAGVSLMLIGSVLQRTPNLTVTARLVNVKSGNIVSSQRVGGYTSDKLFGLVDTLAYLLRNDLTSAVSPSPASENNRVSEVTTTSPEAYRLYVIGLDRARRFLISEAKSALNQAIALDSNFAMAYYALGSRNISNDVSRLALLKKARDLDARVTEKERLLIDAEYLEFVEGKTQEAADVLERFVEKYPQEVGYYEKLAVAYARLGKFEKSLETYQHALQKDSQEKEVWNDIAYTYAGLNRRGEAFDAINRYLDMQPGEPNPYDSKGELYLISGDRDSASIWLKKALVVRPDFFSSEKLGYMMLGERNYDAADRYFLQLSSSPDPDQRNSADLDRLLIPVHQGKIREGQRGILKRLPAVRQSGLKGSYVDLLQTLFMVSWELGDIDAMTRTSAELVELEKDQIGDPIRDQDLAVVALQTRGDVQGARRMLDDLQHSIEEKGNVFHVRALYNQALVAEIEGKHGEAAGLFRDALSLTYPVHAPDYAYGVAMLRAGQTDDAIRELERYTRWVPISFPPINLGFLPYGGRWAIAIVKAHYWLGVAYEQKGRRADAAREYHTFLNTWRNADFPSQELKDARARLARLEAMTSR